MSRGSEHRRYNSVLATSTAITTCRLAEENQCNLAQRRRRHGEVHEEVLTPCNQSPPRNEWRAEITWIRSIRLEGSR